MNTTPPHPLPPRPRPAGFHHVPNATFAAVSDQQSEDLVELAALVCRTPMALLSMVDASQPLLSLKIRARTGIQFADDFDDASFCRRVLSQPQAVYMVPDILLDEHLSKAGWFGPVTPIRFCAGVPVRDSEGHPLGTLCVLDRVPRILSQVEQITLRGLARQAMWQVESSRQMDLLKLRERQLEQSQENLRGTLARLKVLSTTDVLTELCNRRAFEEKLKEEFERARRYDLPLSVLMLDVDHFKTFNDTLGHAAGDALLRAVARMLVENARACDMAARYGGDEFAVILPNTDSDVATRLAERLRWAGRRLRCEPNAVSLSIGVAALGPAMVDRGELMAAADDALYRAKKNGRNRVAGEK